MKIGITDCGEKHPIYEKWILSQNSLIGTPHIEVVKLGYEYNNLHEIEQCDGIVLTGGEDVHPSLYNRPEFLSLCSSNFMDERRDEFEWKVCEYIFKKQTPVLGICRGLQLVNVFLGGTLIPDLPTAGKENHSKYYEGQDRYHSVEILHDSELSKITNIVFGDVNSAHHQSVDLIAKPLKINALSNDRVVEGLEFDFAHSPQFDFAHSPQFDFAHSPQFDFAHSPQFVFTDSTGFGFAHPTELDSVADRSHVHPTEPNSITSVADRSRSQRNLSQPNHYIMLVQWHPERIINAEQNNFSYKIRQDFVENIQSKIQ